MPIPFRLITAWALLVTVFGARAGEAASPENIGPEAIRAHVEFLADDLLEGRRAGTRGYDLAAAYVATQFRLYGLEPGGDDGGYLQHFDLLEATAVENDASLVLEHDGRQTRFAVREDFLPWEDPLAAETHVEAPLAFAGYGISAPELEFDDLGSVDLEGKVAVVLTGAPASFPDSQRAYYSSSKLKYTRLKQAGAVGVITVATRVDNERVPWERRLEYADFPGMIWKGPDGRTSADSRRMAAGATLRTTSAAPLFEGSGHTLDEVLDAADAGVPMSFDLPGTIEIRASSREGTARSSNVLGILPGSDPQLKDEYVILTAHLDHIGVGEPVDGDAIYNGAWDNATGVGILLEIARVMSKSPRPRRSVIFAAVGAEEFGLLGSDYFAEYPTVPLDAIVANINMDMPYSAVPTKDFVGFGAEHTSLGPLARAAATAEGYTLSADPIPEEVIFVRSDQFSFVLRGIPAIYLDGGYTPEDPTVDAQALTKAFFAEHYHRPSDDTSQAIPYETLAGLARINLRVLRGVADGDGRAVWNSGDFFGKKFGGAMAAP